MYGAYGVIVEYNEIGPNNVPGAGNECNGIKMAGNQRESGDGQIIRYNHIHGFSNGCVGQGIRANGNGGGAPGMFIY